jgi:histidinol-phosphate/aromatic aminotransferase/cobyric acid decarboxylase-like protein
VPAIQRIASFVGVPPHMVVLGLGIEDLVRTLIMLSCDPGSDDKYLITWQSCAMFALYADIFNVTCIKVETDPDNPPTIDDLIARVNEHKPRLVVLPNPGQPVETCYSPTEVAELAQACSAIDAVLAMDEAYYGFGAPTALSLVEDFDNLLVLRTFSKAFGAAGIRVGFAVGQYRALHPLEAIRLSGEVAGPSLRTVRRLLAHWPDVIEPGIQDVVTGRDWLASRLRVDGFKVVGGKYANHVLVDMGGPQVANLAWKALQEHGVYVRGGMAPPLDRHLLITCGPLHLMEQFYHHFCEGFRN